MTDMHDDHPTADLLATDPSTSDAVRPDTALPPADRPDPVLVRPYVGPAPDKPGRDPADAPTVIQPAIVDEPPALSAPPPRRPRLGVPLRLLILAGGLAVALALA